MTDLNARKTLWRQELRKDILPSLVKVFRSSKLVDNPIKWPIRRHKVRRARVQRTVVGHRILQRNERIEDLRVGLAILCDDRRDRRWTRSLTVEVVRFVTLRRTVDVRGGSRGSGGLSPGAFRVGEGACDA